MKKRRFNVYGYWQFTDIIPLSCGVSNGDVVYVFSKQGEMVKALTTFGKLVDFHVSNLEQNYFIRPGRGHFPGKCLDRKRRFYVEVGCPECTIFKAIVKLKKVLGNGSRR